MLAFPDELELRWCLKINALSRDERIRRFFSLVSRLGDRSAWIILGGITAWLQGPSAGGFVLHAMLTTGAGILVYTSLKNRLVRERPFMTHGEILCGTAPLDRYSFPSGHTLHAIGLTVLCGAYEPIMLIIMAPFAALVAASRIVLGLHYPTDVLVGGSIGAAIATLSLSLVG